MRGALGYSKVLVAALLVVSAHAQEPAGQKAAEESADAQLARMKKATAREERSELVEKLIAREKPVIEKLKQLADQRIADLEKQYSDALNSALRAQYIERLTSLTDEQIVKIQNTRRLWKPYLPAPIHDNDFFKTYLLPAREVAGMLLLNVEQLPDEKVKALRSELLEYGEYQGKCRQALGYDPDPTRGRKAPTGVEIPPLNSPPTFQSNLNFFERTLVLASTVAPEGARKVLMKNVDVAREIDIEEADFVMYANEIRMTMGSIAWVADPLLCACTRDHSTDRKDGKASAHMSTIPGKEGFVARAKRFGTHAASEGAGGGRNGRNYLEGLSHEGDGHTGPLYGMGRNVIGVGRRDGVYTSNYRTDGDLVHPCQAKSGELFMPPGITARDISNPTVASAFNCMKNSQYGAANTIVARALEPAPATVRSSAAVLAGLGGGSGGELAPRDRMLLRFFQAAIQAEMNWRIQELEAFNACGDVYESKCRLDSAAKDFQGIPAFAERLAPFVERLKSKEAAQELQAGYTYHAIATVEATDDARIQNVKLFCQKFKDSIYTQAAEMYLAKTDENSPFSFFLKKSAALGQYTYPPQPKHAKR